MAPVVVRCKGMWIGWPGIHLKDEKEPIPESDPNDHTPTAGLRSDKVKDSFFHDKAFKLCNLFVSIHNY